MNNTLKHQPSSRHAAAYFDGKASDYGARSNSGLWQFIRRHEAACFLNVAGDPGGHSVLDLGSGAGYYAARLLELGATEVHAVDLSDAMIRSLPTQIHGTVGDIASCRLGKSFSRLVCAGALEFVDDPSSVFANAFRHATPGARFTTLTPRNTVAGKLYRSHHARRGVTIRLFDVETMAKLGVDSGWVPEQAETCLPFALVHAFRKPL